MAAVSVVPTILDYLCDEIIRTEVLPRARNVYSANEKDVKIVLSLLACIAKVIMGPCISLSGFFQKLELKAKHLPRAGHIPQEPPKKK